MSQPAPLSVAELAAFLGVTPARIRQVIREHDVRPVGRRWKAKLYRPGDVLRWTGTRDRLARPRTAAGG